MELPILTLNGPQALYGHGRSNGRIPALFVGSSLLCGFGAGTLVLLAGQKLRLFPSPEELDRKARPRKSVLGRCAGPKVAKILHQCEVAARVVELRPRCAGAEFRTAVQKWYTMPLCTVFTL